MTNLIHALLNSHEADNNVLFSLLFFLHFQEIESVDVDGPISQLDEDLLVIAISLMDSTFGIDVPESYLEDKTKTVRKLADEIRGLPKLTESEFQKKLLLSIAGWRSIMDMN
jgi:hypothetical protein